MGGRGSPSGHDVFSIRDDKIHQVRIEMMSRLRCDLRGDEVDMRQGGEHGFSKFSGTECPSVRVRQL